MKTLVIIDVQRDFYHPNGSLYVNGGENVVENIAKFIKEHANELKDIIFTMDWHPHDLKSYREPKIAWPVHCEQNSEGAGVANELIKACYEVDITPKFFYKGQTAPHTEYGAFEKIGVWCYGNGDLDIVVNNRVNDCTLHFDTTNIIVCGIAGDYCVLNTIKNLQKFNNGDRPFDLNIEVFMDGIASIDDGTTLNNFVKENNLNIIQ